ncbi:MAG TPA: DEAD/DEAH box helicase [Rhodanobacteraceae bacterium]|nr:DEAD/DEAH box helicase [Rhodanobacteraceae bacterium]
MTLSELQQWLAHHEWHSTFDSRTLSRGQQYAGSHRVKKLAVIDPTGHDSCHLHGRVAGSGGHIYTCDITITRADRHLLAESDCSCPVAVDCKHAAAMLFSVPAFASVEAPPPQSTPSRLDAAAEREKTAALQRWQEWLALLDAPARTAPTVADTQRFGILLRGDINQRLLAFPAWLQPAKNTRRERWSKPSSIDLSADHGPIPAPAAGWPDATATALSVLLSQPSYAISGHNWFSIRSPQAERALETLLAEHPAWFERASQPLQRGPELRAEPRWVEAADGSQSLTMQLDATDAILLKGARQLWYINPATAHYGVAPGDVRLFEQLAHAPTLLPAIAPTLGSVLGQHRASVQLPAPLARAPAKVVRVAPVGVLTLAPTLLHSFNGTSVIAGSARLVFDYAGQRVERNATARVITRRVGEDLLEIHRDRDAENALPQRLRHAGLVTGTELLSRYRPHDYTELNAWFAVVRNHPAPLPPEDWTDTLTQLEQAGFVLEFSPDFPHDSLVEIDAWHNSFEARGNHWFDVSLGVDIAGERIDLLPVLRQLIANPAFPRQPTDQEKPDARWRVPLDENRSVELPLTQLRGLIEPLLEWLETESSGTPRVHATQLADFDGSQLAWPGGEALRAKLENLRAAPAHAKLPRGFKASLRPYQHDGLAWLNFLEAAGMGGILADDMGLGKTVQVLAHLLGMKQRKRLTQPALVVCPTSLVGNWQAEAAHFTPTLNVLVLHGADRAERYDAIATHDLVITTYPLLPRDRDKLVEQQFSLLILDEAQAIKNAASQAAQVVRDIPAARRLAMTGTPLENHLGELWAQFDAVEPGLLGSQRQFNRRYRTPIEKHGDSDRQQRLNRRIGALMLRRRKNDVLADLPPKTEIVRTLELEAEQRALYETLRLAQHERVRQAVAERGLAKSGIIVLDALLKLRQACCDPRLVKLASAKKVKTSAKLDALLELLDGLLADGRRVLLFSQFTEMLALIEAALAKRKLPYQTLTGQTPARERTALVKRFQQGELPLFLISLKAGGVGLNLTAADTVIHYDPWWNPAVEAQATDRAHRIGQQQSVFVYRLICTGTVEEKIQTMQAKKAELARAVLEGGGASSKLRFNEADLDALFGPT